jgi:hypothetical protein
MTACNDVPTVLTWPLHATVGTLTSPQQAPPGPLPGLQGDDALVRCDLRPAGKFRHGAARWWCRTHMQTWGTLADLADAGLTQRMRCARHDNPMGYAVAPPLIDPAAYDSVIIRQRQDGREGALATSALRIVLMSASTGEKTVDAPALSLRVPPGLFTDAAISMVHVTPPAVRAFTRALEEGRALGCVDCRRCGHPHLDLGEFASRVHRRHLCGHCGCDSIYSSEHMVSTPLHALCRLNVHVML